MKIIITILCLILINFNLYAENKPDRFIFTKSDKLKLVVKNKTDFNIEFIVLKLNFDLDQVVAIMIEDLNLINLKCANYIIDSHARLYVTKVKPRYNIKELTTHLKRPCVFQDTINLRLKIVTLEKERLSNDFKTKLFLSKYDKYSKPD